MSTRQVLAVTGILFCSAAIADVKFRYVGNDEGKVKTLTLQSPYCEDPRCPTKTFDVYEKTEVESVIKALIRQEGDKLQGQIDGLSSTTGGKLTALKK